AATPERKKELYLAYYDALGKAAIAVRSYSPVTRPHGEDENVEPHAGMTKWLVNLSQAITKVMDDVDKLDGVKLTDSRSNYQPALPTVLGASEWRTVFTAGVSQAHLPNDDSGVGAAMKKMDTATQATQNAQSQTKQKQRVANLALRDAYNEVIACMKA